MCVGCEIYNMLKKLFKYSESFLLAAIESILLFGCLETTVTKL